MNSKEMMEKWFQYSKSNGIRTPSTDGRPVDHTDLIEFLKINGFEKSSIESAFEKSGLSVERSKKPRYSEYLDDIKSLIDDMTTRERTQFLRELK